MTIGELARLFNDHFGIGADLEVVDDGGLDARDVSRRGRAPWVMPSPNMPTLDTAIVYPGTVLFEGTNVSEGRGTTRPFELVGAPWVDGRAVRGRAERAARCRRVLPAGRLRADVSQAREDDLRRRARSTSPIARRSVRCWPACCSPRRSARRPGGVRLAGAAVRVRTREAAVRHPGGHVGHARADRARACRAEEIARSWEPSVAAFRALRRSSCCTRSRSTGTS